MCGTQLLQSVVKRDGLTGMGWSFFVLRRLSWCADMGLGRARHGACSDCSIAAAELVANLWWQTTSASVGQAIALRYLKYQKYHTFQGPSCRSPLHEKKIGRWPVLDIY